jgi:hypothetical protein
VDAETFRQIAQSEEEREAAKKNPSSD